MPSSGSYLGGREQTPTYLSKYQYVGQNLTYLRIGMSDKTLHTWGSVCRTKPYIPEDQYVGQNLTYLRISMSDKALHTWVSVCRTKPCLHIWVSVCRTKPYLHIWGSVCQTKLYLHIWGSVGRWRSLLPWPRVRPFRTAGFCRWSFGPYIVGAKLPEWGPYRPRPRPAGMAPTERARRTWRPVGDVNLKQVSVYIENTMFWPAVKTLYHNTIT